MRQGSFTTRVFVIVALLGVITAPNIVRAETAQPNYAPLLPVEAFAELPPYADISLSPDGHQGVALRAIHGTYHAVLLDFETGQSRVLMASDPENFLFNWCRFANPTRVVCSIRSYIVMKAGYIDSARIRGYRDGRTVATRLLAIDVDGRNQLQLIPKTKPRARGELEWNSPNQDDVISWLPNDAKHILVQVAREDRVSPSVYKLNIYTNKIQRKKKFLPSISRWYADHEGNIRFAIGRRNDLTPIAYSFEAKQRKSLDITRFEGINPPSMLGFAKDGKSVFMIANHNGANTRGLYRVDLSTAKVVETLAEHPTFDLTRYWRHDSTRQILYVGYNENGEHLTWLNKDIEQAVAQVRAKLGYPRFMNVLSATPNLSHLIVYFEGNGVKPSYYRFTLADKSLIKLSSFKQGPIVDFDYITYTARDGKEIPAYLALPGPRENGPYPTIIDPHGGPWSEDTGSYFFWNQYFLNRGYALLKPNFRGSTGYGDAFTQAGFGAWGEQMQDDIIDGLDWMIDQKLTDPQRVCIHGGSYGGYVALVAAYKTPEKFNCAISFAGVSDLTELKQKSYLFKFGRLAAARLPRGKLLLQNSPMENIAQIKIPILLVHGDVDRSAMVEQSRDFAAALTNAGIEHTYIEQANGDHFLSLQKHRLEYLQALDTFLSTHLGPP